MPLSRPDRFEILSTLEAFLEEKKPLFEGAAGYEARIAIGLVRTLARELHADASFASLEASGLAELVPDAPPEARATELCTRIRDGRLAWDDPRLVAHLRETTLAKIAIDQPKYASFVDTREHGFPRDRR